MLLAIAVPEQLATSRLAGMPPITGFYAFIAGTLGFALLGTNPQLSVGADSTIAPLFAVGVGHLATSGSGAYTGMVGLLAVMVGALLALVWLLRLGWVAEFLSAPIIAGFLAGVAVVIVVHQLPDLLGISVPGGTTLHRLAFAFDHAGQAGATPIALGFGVLLVIVLLDRLDRRLPGALAALLLATVAVAICDLRDHGVAVLGHVANHPPHLGLPALSVSALGRLAPLAAVVALVVVTQSAATTRAFPDESDREVSVDRDMLAVGAGNALAGLIGAFPVNASPPRTAAVAAASGRTQAAGLLSAAALLVLVPAAGLLQDVPLAALAGVLIFVAIRIFRVGDLIAIARFDRFEAVLALVTLLTVALVGVEQGIGVAVGLAILDRSRLSARPHLHVLGRIPGTTSWAPRSHADGAEQVPGVLVVLFAAPLWYANSTNFRSQLHDAVRHAPERPRLVVLDVIGMSDIDYTGARALSDALDELDRKQTTVAVARAGDRLREGLAHAGLLERIGEERFFPSVDEAVSALAAKYGDGSPLPTDGADSLRD